MNTNGNDLSRAREVLERLEVYLSRRLPEWSGFGAEDPARVLLEAFALRLAELERRVDGLGERLLPRVFSDLGMESGWPRASRSVVSFVPAAGLKEAIRIPAGTGVTGAREPDGGRADESRPRVTFETCADAWLSPAHLRRAFSLEGDDVTELPVATWPSIRHPAEERGEAAVAIFQRATLDRYLYLGDPVWEQLRVHGGELILEWPEISHAIIEGVWEYGVHGGWRTLPVTFTEGVDAVGEKVLQMRVAGRLPDLADVELDGVRSTWLRHALPGERRIRFPLPRIVRLPVKDAPSPGTAESDPGDDEASVLHSLPRAVSRVFSFAGGCWEDHTFADTKRVTAIAVGDVWFPAVYLGWDSPLPASVYVKMVQGAPPPGAPHPRLDWEHSTRNGFKRFDVADDTLSFSRSGNLSWSLQKDWSAREEFGERLYWVRARWKGGAYHREPLLEGLFPSSVEVREGRTLRDWLLNVVLEPGQSCLVLPRQAEGDLERFDALDVSDGDGWRRLSHARRGRAPAEGEFRLRRLPDGVVELEVAPGSVTETSRVKVPEARVGVGGATAIPAGTLDLVESAVAGLERLVQPLPAQGGRAAESLEEFARRVRAEAGGGGRAVTADDVQRLIQAVDPGIARTEVVVDPEEPARWTVVVVPEPPFHPGRFAAARLSWIANYLEPRVPLGTIVSVVEPCYVPSTVLIRETARDSRATEEQRAGFEEALRSFVHPLTGGADGRGFPLGKVLRPQEIEPIMGRFFCSEEPEGRSRFEIETTGGEETTPRPCPAYPVLEHIEWVTREDPD